MTAFEQQICQKRQLYQMCHNYCPSRYLITWMFVLEGKIGAYVKSLMEDFYDYLCSKRQIISKLNVIFLFKHKFCAFETLKYRIKYL